MEQNPKSGEVYEYFLRNYGSLRFSPSVSISLREREILRDRKVNPKRLQREAGKTLRSHGASTRSRQALQLMREQMKTERKSAAAEKGRQEERRRFELKQQKKKQKHRGR